MLVRFPVRRLASPVGVAAALALVLLAVLAVPAAQLWSRPAGATTSTSDPAPVERATPDQPNLVVIMVDDMREDDLAFMPQTRRLIGHRGVRFANAFTPYPLCCPSRSSFLTGRYTHNHGVWSHLDPWGFQSLRDRETLPVWLQRSGYRTIFMGKYLNGYGAQSPRDGSSPSTYVPPGWTDWHGALDRGLDGGGSTYDLFNTPFNVNGDYESHPGDYQTDVLGKKTVEVIEREARKAKPFFMWASYTAPHHASPVEADDPEGLDTTARPKRVHGRFDSVITTAPGAAGEADVSDKPWFIRKLPPLTDAQLEAIAEVTRQRAEALSVVDHQVSRTIRALWRTDQLDDTIVAFTSDNGYFLGEHRIQEGKRLPYEPALSVPLLVRGPGIPAGEVRRDPFTSIDFAPTLLEAAGARRGATIDGVSLLDVLRHGDRGWHRGVLTDFGPRQRGPLADTTRRYSVGVRAPGFLFVRHVTGGTELYDMRRDPGQLRNVAKHPAYREVREAFNAYLRDLRRCDGRDCAAPLPQAILHPR